MVATGKVLQIGDRNQYSAADSSRREMLVGDEIIQSALTNGEHLRSFLTTDQQFAVRRNSSGIS